MPRSANWQERWQSAKSFIVEVWNRIGEDRIPIIAGGISFFFLLSLVPLLLLAVSITAFLLNSQMDALVPKLSSYADDLGPIIADVFNRQIIPALKELVGNRFKLIWVAVLFGLWTGSQIFSMLESALNIVWHTVRRRPYWISRGLAIVLTILMGSLMFVAVVLSNAVGLIRSIQHSLFGYEVGVVTLSITKLGSLLIPMLLMAVIFGILYRVLPTKPVTTRSVIPGAALAGALWLLLVHLFSWYATNIGSWYVQNIGHDKIVYGSLGGIILLMFWFYSSAFVMLLGAEISAVYHRRLVEAGNPEERLLEEEEQATETRREWENFHQRAEGLDDCIAYYGYQSSTDSSALIPDSSAEILPTRR
ncbi:MAG: YihY/virulence factor BrkB family protein [Armatimonadota bacterium]